MLRKQLTKIYVTLMKINLYKVNIALKYATTYHEKTAEIHATQNRIFHLRNAQKNAQKFPLLLQSCQQCRGRALQIKKPEYILGQ